jgi:hypothetical protein
MKDGGGFVEEGPKIVMGSLQNVDGAEIVGQGYNTLVA